MMSPMLGGATAVGAVLAVVLLAAPVSVPAGIVVAAPGLGAVFVRFGIADRMAERVAQRMPVPARRRVRADASVAIPDVQSDIDELSGAEPNGGGAARLPCGAGRCGLERCLPRRCLGDRPNGGRHRPTRREAPLDGQLRREGLPRGDNDCRTHSSSPSSTATSTFLLIERIPLLGGS